MEILRFLNEFKAFKWKYEENMKDFTDFNGNMKDFTDFNGNVEDI
jgi:hypothetical protein